MKLVSHERYDLRGHGMLRMTFDNGKTCELDAEAGYKWLIRANAVHLGEEFAGDVPPRTCRGETFEGVTTDPEVVAVVRAWLKEGGERPNHETKRGTTAMKAYVFKRARKLPSGKRTTCWMVEAVGDEGGRQRRGVPASSDRGPPRGHCGVGHLCRQFAKPTPVSPSTDQMARALGSGILCKTTLPSSTVIIA